MDLPILIVGGAAGFGCGIICACKTKVKIDLYIYCFFHDGSVLFFGFV
jgi:hypothetical protein